MNRERAKELLPIIQAFADGEDIEICHFSDGWITTTSPNFTATPDKYRIKSRPREWWINTTSSECYVTKECAEKFSGGKEIVWVREVSE